MELLDVHHLTTYQRGEPLFQPLDLRLVDGMRIGLIGPNGAGKSTLLRLLAGMRAPDGGRVSRPPGVRVAYLPQRFDGSLSGTVWETAGSGLRAVREAEARLRAEERRLADGEPRAEALADALETFEALGGYRAEADLRAGLAAVGLSEACWERPAATLSGGERRRLALAAALAGDPEVLLLDEPTNHLDLRMRSWLAQRLADWRGAVIVVSHDRMLLDGATNATLFLQGGSWQLRRGPYGRARRALERDLLALRKRDAERAKEAARLAAMAEQLARRHDRGSARRRHVAERHLEALGNRPSPAGRATGPGAELQLASRRLQGRLLEGRALRRQGVVEVAHVVLGAGQRVAVLGPNGSGKSTLLALLAGELASDDPRAELHYPPGLRLELVGQLDRGLAPGVPVLDQVATGVGDARARRLLAEAGVGADRWSEPPERLSGGEQARAGLARLEARQADLILLDEPGNDLDLAAVEALESALRDSPAALVLATHDRR
ncbi:MAG: ATP-binding cassette domain-containing protein, partial [Deinococcales bacterium]